MTNVNSSQQFSFLKPRNKVHVYQTAASQQFLHLTWGPTKKFSSDRAFYCHSIQNTLPSIISYCLSNHSCYNLMGIYGDLAYSAKSLSYFIIERFLQVLLALEKSLNKFENSYMNFTLLFQLPRRKSYNYKIISPCCSLIGCLKEKTINPQRSNNFTTDVHTMTSFLMFEFTRAAIRFAINLRQLLHRYKS